MSPFDTCLLSIHTHSIALSHKCLSQLITLLSVSQFLPQKNISDLNFTSVRSSLLLSSRNVNCFPSPRYFPHFPAPSPVYICVCMRVCEVLFYESPEILRLSVLIVCVSAECLKKVSFTELSICRLDSPPATGSLIFLLFLSKTKQD